MKNFNKRKPKPWSRELLLPLEAAKNIHKKSQIEWNRIKPMGEGEGGMDHVGKRWSDKGS